MAGGQETPRQKMIGMMYLVLTALLALQVSNAVLEKFAIIEATLVEMLAEGQKKNAGALKAIVDEAGKRHDPRVVQARENAQKIRTLTQTTLQNIDQLKEKFITMSGSDKIDEKIINDHSSKVAAMMMSQKEGTDFEKLLNDYVAALKDLSGLPATELPTLAKSPKEMPLFATDDDHANKDFLEFTFENTPVIAALASVTQIQTEILEYETKALDKLLKDAGIGKISFENMVPMVRPVSSVVAAGASYEADMFITASSESFVPEMFRDGQKLELFTDKSGVKMGKVKFTATAGTYDPATNLAKKTFKAEIKLPDTTLIETIEYFVAAPVIKVTTGVNPTLYMNCGNQVNIEVPSLGQQYNPSFQAKGAEVIKSDTRSKVTIIPSERKATVTVINAGGANLGSVTFDVKQIPLPRYVIKDNAGKEIDKKNGVRGSALTGLRVIPEADPNFKEEVPADANYRIRTMEVIHARGTTPVNTMNATSENIDLGAWRAQFKPNDRLVITIKTVIRRTFKGGEEKVDVKNEIFQIPIQ